MSDTSFYRRKLFSFLGLGPMAIYLIVHLSAHAFSHQAPTWEARLEGWHSNPYYWPVVLLFVYFPFAFHAVWGVVLALTARPNNARMPYFSNFKYLAQRISAVGLILFLAAHIFKTRIEPALQGQRQLTYDHMVEAMHNPLSLAVYVLGVLAAAFHLANGFWLGGITWGVTISRRSQRNWQAWSIAIFVVIAVMGFAAMAGFARAPFHSAAGHVGR